MIYTTYFAKLNKLPQSIFPVSVSLYLPKGILITELKVLAPTKEILFNYKNDKDEIKYKNDYIEKVLNKLNATELVNYLYSISNNKDVALICYESPEKFCHRHIIAEWLNNNGIDCREYKEEVLNDSN